MVRVLKIKIDLVIARDYLACKDKELRSTRGATVAEGRCRTLCGWKIKTKNLSVKLSLTLLRSVDRRSPGEECWGFSDFFSKYPFEREK